MVDVTAKIDEIKRCMPETYKSIQAKAQQIGGKAYALVRQGLRGEANCFYAFENGYVVGTPFTLVEIQRDIAQLMVTLGASHVCLWEQESCV